MYTNMHLKNYDLIILISLCIFNLKTIIDHLHNIHLVLRTEILTCF